jgi:long-chain acyl-CoA synthetase
VKVGTFLAGHALRAPGRDAIVCGEERVGYADLHRSATGVARALRARGVRPGDRVIVALDNGPAWIEAFFGTLMCGAIVVPVNTRLTAAELRHVIADCAPVAAFGAPSHEPLIADASGRRDLAWVRCDPHGRLTAFAQLGGEPLPALATDVDDAMICYTSGTTGRPKGAVITHANLLVMALMNDVDWRLTPDDRILVTTPLAHRTAIARLLNALSLGASLVVMKAFDAREVVETIARERVTVAGMVPTIVRMLLDEIERDPARCATLRVVLATGEAFPVAAKERLLRALPSLRLYSFLASTEAGSITTLGPDEQVSHATSVGRPTVGVEVRLLDEERRDVPTGEVGEIVVRCGAPGNGIAMRAYYRRPAETAEALRDGWLQTGDLGRFDADGYLYVVDRKKDMILSGGFNVYSKEVERALIAHPAVADAAVIGVPDPIYGESVAAFVERRAGESVDAETLIAHCRTLIASYKKPRTIRFVDALPRTSVGKVLKVQLRAQYAETAATAPDAVAPLWLVRRASEGPRRYAVEPFDGGTLDEGLRRSVVALYGSEAAARDALAGDALFGYVRPCPSGRADGAIAYLVFEDAAGLPRIEPAGEGEAAFAARDATPLAIFRSRDDAERCFADRIGRAKVS